MTTKNNISRQNDILVLLHRICDTFQEALSPPLYRDLVFCLIFIKYLSETKMERTAHYQALYPEQASLIKELINTDRFIVPETGNFQFLFSQRHDLGNSERLNLALHSLESANPQLNDVLQNFSFNHVDFVSQLQKNNILRRVLTLLGKKELRFTPSDDFPPSNLSQSYISLLDHFSRLSCFKKKPAFYSPVELPQLLVKLLAPKLGDSIYDPACGSAGLLLQFRQYINVHYSDHPDYTLFGQEKNRNTWALAKMNLYIHEEDQHRIECSDSLRNPLFLEKSGELKKFDIAACIPSFSNENWGAELAENDKYQRFSRGIPPKNKNEYAFICHMLSSLKNEGKLAIVVPHGVLFREGIEGKIRQQLIDEKWIDAVIGLPEKLFYDTSIATVLLILRQQDSQQGILFIDASGDFKESKAQNHLAPEHIEKIHQSYIQRKDTNNYSHLASYDEIRSKHYNLHIPLYINKLEQSNELDLDSVIRKREGIQNQLSDLECDIAQGLKELINGR